MSDSITPPPVKRKVGRPITSGNARKPKYKIGKPLPLTIPETVHFENANPYKLKLTIDEYLFLWLRLPPERRTIEYFRDYLARKYPLGKEDKGKRHPSIYMIRIWRQPLPTDGTPPKRDKQHGVSAQGWDNKAHHYDEMARQTTLISNGFLSDEDEERKTMALLNTNLVLAFRTTNLYLDLHQQKVENKEPVTVEELKVVHQIAMECLKARDYMLDKQIERQRRKKEAEAIMDLVAYDQARDVSPVTDSTQNADVTIDMPLTVQPIQRVDAEALREAINGMMNGQ